MSEKKKQSQKIEQKPRIKKFSTLDVDKAEYQEIVLSQSNNNSKGFGRDY